MAHQNFPFIHERAKASLDSNILDKWDADLSTFLHQMEEHKQLPEPRYSVYIHQYTTEEMAGSNNYTDEPNVTNPNVKNHPAILSEPAYVTQVFCSPDCTIADLKRLYYTERVKAQKRRAKAAFYRRVEREGGLRKLEQIKEREAAERAQLGAEWVDPVEVVLPEEVEQCSYAWGFLTVEEYEKAEARREQRARQGRFVPARVAVTNLRFAGQFLKDYHTLDQYGIPPGASIVHTLRFPDVSELMQ